MPGIQPEIANLTDDFSYQVSNVRSHTGTTSYTWMNTGISADVEQVGTISSGSASLTITDAVGTQVYGRSLSDDGTFVTADGAAGSWTIRVSYTAATGSVNFRSQKTP